MHARTDIVRILINEFHADVNFQNKVVNDIYIYIYWHGTRTFGDKAADHCCIGHPGICAFDSLLYSLIVFCLVSGHSADVGL